MSLEIDASKRVDGSNPFPGLRPFFEDESQFFLGRSKQSSDLFRRVRRRALTVVFGASGLGKSSLLNAGLAPKLRGAGYLPIFVRLFFKSDTSLTEQVVFSIQQAAESVSATIDQGGTGKTIWEFLHRSVIWTKSFEPLTPVLIFDQFEELFTIGDDDPHVEHFIEQLADLVENRVPRSVFDLPIGRNEQHYRVVFGLREDFLPHLENLKSRIPSVMENRQRLTAMTGAEALEVIAQSEVLASETVSQQVVRFVAADQKDSEKELSKLSVEPALLSVVCQQLLSRNVTDTLSVTENQGQIITDFYEECVSVFVPEVREFIEESLITSSGFRDTVVIEELPQFISGSVIDELIKSRLIRREFRGGIERIELTHDLLTGVIKSSRDIRDKESAQQAELKKALVAQKKRFVRMSAAIFFVLVAGVVYWDFFASPTSIEIESPEVDGILDLTKKNNTNVFIIHGGGDYCIGYAQGMIENIYSNLGSESFHRSSIRSIYDNSFRKASDEKFNLSTAGNYFLLDGRCNLLSSPPNSRSVGFGISSYEESYSQERLCSAIDSAAGDSRCYSFNVKFEPVSINGRNSYPIGFVRRVNLPKEQGGTITFYEITWNPSLYGIEGDAVDFNDLGSVVSAIRAEGKYRQESGLLANLSLLKAFSLATSYAKKSEIVSHDFLFKSANGDSQLDDTFIITEGLGFEVTLDTLRILDGQLNDGFSDLKSGLYNLGLEPNSILNGDTSNSVGGASSLRSFIRSIRSIYVYNKQIPLLREMPKDTGGIGIKDSTHLIDWAVPLSEIGEKVTIVGINDGADVTSESIKCWLYSEVLKHNNYVKDRIGYEADRLATQEVGTTNQSDINSVRSLKAFDIRKSLNVFYCGNDRRLEGDFDVVASSIYLDINESRAAPVKFSDVSVSARTPILFREADKMRLDFWNNEGVHKLITFGIH